MKRLLLCCLSLLACVTSRPSPGPAPLHATLAFRDVRVFDGRSVLPRTTVLVDGGRIVAVGPDLAVPAGAEVIEDRGLTLLPGLIDAHAHVMDAANLRQALAFGVTTVLDLGSGPESVRVLEPKARATPGIAALRSAGYLVTVPHGHGDEFGGDLPTLSAPEQTKAFIDARIAEGSDFIKLIIEDGSELGVKLPTLSEGEVRDAIAEAHRRGKKVVVHVGNEAEAREAIDAGADGLAHTFFDAAPDAFVKDAATRHVFVTPTLTVLHRVCEPQAKTAVEADPRLTALLGGGSAAQLSMRFPLHCVRGGFGNAQRSVVLLEKAQVPLLAGTDSPNPGTTYGASLHEELAELVQAGLTPTEALTAATAAPAQAYGLADRGRVAPGLRADLVLVKGDPTADITATRNLAGIWRGGVRFDTAAYVASLQARQQAAGAGLLSDFEGGKPDAHFGAGWMPSTDQMIGGSSTAKYEVVEGGAEGSHRALEVTGEVRGPSPYAWAGALAFLGEAPFTPVDLSAKKALHFWAKGDGQTYRVMLFAKHLGPRPAVQTFVAGQAWKEISLPLDAFELDGKDLTAVAFVGGPQPGAFELRIDQVAFR